MLHWTAEASDQVVSVHPSAGTAKSDLETIAVDIDVGGLPVGAYELGEVTLTGSAYGHAVQSSPTTFPVILYVVEDVHRTFLPLVVSTVP